LVSELGRSDLPARKASLGVSLVFGCLDRGYVVKNTRESDRVSGTVTEKRDESS